MQPTLEGAVTSCTKCKRDVPLTESICPNCKSLADATSSFVSFKRPDGSTGMIDQLTLSFLRSPNPSPSQSDIEELLKKTNRVEYLELERVGQEFNYQKRLTLLDPADLSKLKECLHIEDTEAHLMSAGGPRLDFYRDNDLVAKMEILDSIIRWDQRWNTDGGLTDPSRLAGFLKSKKMTFLADERENQKRRNQERAAEYLVWKATWEPAIPRGLELLVERLSRDPMAMFSSKDRPHALELLAENYRSADQQILILIAWYGHGGGPWTGFNASECTPESMLEAYSGEQFLHALENNELSTQQLEGAARFLARKGRKPQWESRIPAWLVHDRVVQTVMASPIRHRLMEHVMSSKSNDKVARFRAIFVE